MNRGSRFYSELLYKYFLVLVELIFMRSGAGQFLFGYGGVERAVAALLFLGAFKESDGFAGEFFGVDGGSARGC